MSDTTNLVLERVNRLSQAVADLMESHAAQGRNLLRELVALRTDVAAMRGELREVAGEQALLANRVEDAISRALRAHIRMDEAEETRRGAAS